MSNLFPDGNCGSVGSWDYSDASFGDGRLNFNAPDGSNLASINVSGLTEGNRYLLEWMQEVTPGDSTCALGLSPACGHGCSGHVSVEFVATGTNMGIQWRGYGSNGPGWMDAFRLTAL